MSERRAGPPGLDGPDGLGAKIRRERNAQGLTLRQVAERADVSVSFLSQIERDEAKPSVGTLHAIAAALGMPLARLFSSASSATPTPRTGATAIVTRSSERKTLIYPGSRIRNELLTPDFKREILMIWVVIPPGESTGDEPLVHEGEECVLVVQGQVEVSVGDGEHYLLGPGDAMWQFSDVPHSSRNTGDTDAIFVLAMTPPSL